MNQVIGAGESSGLLKSYLLPSILMLALGFSSSVASQSSLPSVGIVDVERAFQRSPLLFAVTGRLIAQFRSMQGDIKARGRQLSQLHKNLVHPASPLVPEQRAQLEAQAASVARELNALWLSYHEKRNIAQQEGAERATAQIRQVATTLAKRRGLELRVVNSGLEYRRSDPGTLVDLTDDVIRALIEKTSASRAAKKSN